MTLRLRSEAALTGVPIIAITAKAMRDDQEQCRRAGANDYLAKPIEVDRLVSEMHALQAEIDAIPA